MQNGIRLIACDMDGTLLSHEKSISPENAKALRDASRAGILLCVASGRSPTEIRAMMRGIDVPFDFLSHNGAYLHIEGRPDTVRPMMQDQVAVSIDIAEQYGIGWLVCTAEGAFVCAGQATEWNHTNPTIDRKDALELADGENIIKMLCFAGSGGPEMLTRAKKDALKTELAISSSWANNYETNAPGIHKGNALRDLSQARGIARKDVMAFGDYENDLQMLAWAGWSVAMGNAIPPVAATAKYHTARNDEHGVAQAIYRWALA